jgi:hypothetical protein
MYIDFHAVRHDHDLNTLQGNANLLCFTSIRQKTDFSNLYQWSHWPLRFDFTILGYSNPCIQTKYSQGILGGLSLKTDTKSTSVRLFHWRCRVSSRRAHGPYLLYLDKADRTRRQQHVSRHTRMGHGTSSLPQTWSILRASCCRRPVHTASLTGWGHGVGVYSCNRQMCPFYTSSDLYR